VVADGLRKPSGGAPAGRWNTAPDAMVKLTDHESCRARRVLRRYVVHSPDRRRICRPMEDVLDLMPKRPIPKRPVVCLDESPVQ